jgi:hypothetical protein
MNEDVGYYSEGAGGFGRDKESETPQEPQHWPQNQNYSEESLSIPDIPPGDPEGTHPGKPVDD